MKFLALIPILVVVIIYSKPSRGHIANCTSHHRRHHSRMCKISSSIMPRSNSGGETIARIILPLDSNTEDVIVSLKDSVGGTRNRRNSSGEMMGSNMTGKSSSEDSLSQTQPYQTSSTTSSVPGISSERETNLIIPTEGPSTVQQMENSPSLEADSEEEPSLLIYLKDHATGRRMRHAIPLRSDSEGGVNLPISSRGDPNDQQLRSGIAPVRISGGESSLIISFKTF